MTKLCPSLQPYELSKDMRRGMESIVERIAMKSVIDGCGKDLLLRIYMAGIYHGVELSAQSPQTNGDAIDD